MSRTLQTTIRPRALALGVVAPSRETALHLATFLPKSTADALTEAMLRDALLMLQTFPVRRRFLLDGPEDGPQPAIFLPLATGAETDEERWRLGLAELRKTPCEACLLVRSDAAPLPLGELFDAFLSLLNTRGWLIGPGPVVGFAAGASRLASPPPLPPAASEADLELTRTKAAADGTELKIVAPCAVVDNEAAVADLAKGLREGKHSPSCRELFETDASLRPYWERSRQGA